MILTLKNDKHIWHTWNTIYHQALPCYSFRALIILLESDWKVDLVANTDYAPSLIRKIVHVNT